MKHNGVYETGKKNWQNETLATIAVAVNSTPKKLLSNIASCIKAPFFPQGNALVLTMATLAFGLSFSLWVAYGTTFFHYQRPMEPKLYGKLCFDNVANINGFCYEDSHGNVNG